MCCENKKGIFAPNYYRLFHCIADKCRHSCCIDWEICIDDETYEKYKQMADVIGTIAECEDGPCFVLTKEGRCPHLNEKGLCRIILSHGEDYLSEICQNHPRFYNGFGAGRTEAGLGLVCEEACRLILTNEEPFSLSWLESMEEDGEEEAVCNFDPLPIREKIFAVIEASDKRFEEVVAALKDMFEIPAPYTMKEWTERFAALESLDGNWGRILQTAQGDGNPHDSLVEFGKYYKRLLTYFVYRHVSVAESEDDLRARLGFAILSTEMIRYLLEANGEVRLEALMDIARWYSAEIEYSEDNTDELIFEFARRL